MPKKKPLEAEPQCHTIALANDTFHDIKSAIEDARLVGTVAEIEQLRDASMLLTLDAAHVALMLTTAFDGARMRDEIDERRNGGS